MNAERAARRDAEHRILALRAENRELQERAIHAKRTLAYGLGRALIEARSVKGMLALPRKLRLLGLRQRAKRRQRVPNMVPDNLADHLRLVRAALDKVRTEGAPKAVTWLDAQSEEDDAARARALVEIALDIAQDDPDLAGRIGERAATLSPDEHRLIKLVASLDALGEVRLPLCIIDAMGSAARLTLPQERLFEKIRDRAALLSGSAPALPAAGNPENIAQRPLILFAPRQWADSPRLANAAFAGERLGLNVSVTGVPPDADFGLVHIFADSLDLVEKGLVSANAAGARAIVDIANVPAMWLRHPEHESGRAERLRIERIAAAASALVVRGPAASQMLEQFKLKFDRVEDMCERAYLQTDAPDISAARAEFGLAETGRIWGIVVENSVDPGVERVFRAIAQLDGMMRPATIALIGPPDGLLAAEQAAIRLGLENLAVAIGQPLPMRWRPLFSSFDLVICPQQEQAVLGSAMPMMMGLASALGVDVAMSEAAWKSRTGPLTEAILLANGIDVDWQDALVARPKSWPEQEPLADVQDLSTLYAAWTGQ